MIIFECGIDSLENLLKKKPDIFQENFDLVKKLFSQLFSALVYLRLRNIGHRDIKPANILYFFQNDQQTDYIFKLTDFGVGI